MKIGNFDFNVKPLSDDEREARKQRKIKRLKVKLLGIGICLVVTLILGGLGIIGDDKSKTEKLGLRSDSGYLDATKNGIDKDNPREIAVHNKNFLHNVENSTVLDSSYTFKEVFDNYFVNPKWRAFHDTESDIDVAEFTGRCTYANKDADAIIQMVNDHGHVYLMYMSINDVELPKNQIESFLHDALNTYIQDNVHG